MLRAIPALRTLPLRCYATLTNRTQVLPQIDKLISNGSGNMIEYIYTRPDWSSFARLNSHVLTKIGSQSAQNPYGHAAVRYRRVSDAQTGEHNVDTIMNISRPVKTTTLGDKGDKLANFVAPVDYFFSPQGQGNLQGGIFNRGFITVRIDGLSSEDVQRMDTFYHELQKRNENGTADFQLFFAMVSRTLARWLPGVFGGPSRQEYGNCAYWTSQGLVQAGVLPGFSNWPLVVLFKLMLTELERDPSAPRVNVISYRSLKHKLEPQGALMYPFYWLRHSYKPVWGLEQLATVVVDPVPEFSNQPNDSNNSSSNERPHGSFAVVQPTERYTLAVTQNPAAREQWKKLHREMSRVDAFNKDSKNWRKSM